MYNQNEKYYPKKTCHPTSPTMVESCQLLDNGIMIGSAACKECKYCLGYAQEDEFGYSEGWIMCKNINIATGVDA